jgi:hypothetical protein
MQINYIKWTKKKNMAYGFYFTDQEDMKKN